MTEFPIFTLFEANETAVEVIALTESAVAQLAALDAVWGKLPFRKYDAERGAAEDDLIRAEWARRVAALGVQPKGFFVVDFQSPDPDTLYCWAYGETEVVHEHKTWETFIDRRPLQDVSPFESERPLETESDGTPHALEDESAIDE